MTNSLRRASGRTTFALRRLLAMFFIAGAAAIAIGAASPDSKSESFDRDPGWEGVGNRIVPKLVPTVVQNFGYNATNIAGKAAGEMGGRVMRASEPAYYADNIGTKSLDDKLSASGTLALSKTTPSSG